MPLDDQTTHVRLSGRGSSIEVASLPCHFTAPNYNLLEQLFIPLLSLAQEANDVMGLRVGDSKSAIRASSFLAGELLRG